MDVRAYWRAVLRQDPAEMRPFFHPDAVIRWHATGEQFTVEAFLHATCTYPGQWVGVVQRCIRLPGEIQTVTFVSNTEGTHSAYAVSIFTLQGDRIAALDEYWADVAPPPPWRQGLATPLPGHPPAHLDES